MEATFLVNKRKKSRGQFASFSSAVSSATEWLKKQPKNSKVTVVNVNDDTMKVTVHKVK